MLENQRPGRLRATCFEPDGVAPCPAISCVAFVSWFSGQICAQMPSTDPRRDFAVEVVETLTNAGFTALWAGGCVRDLLLGKAPDDYDVATNARPEQVQDVFGPKRTRAIGASFGVVLVHGARRKSAGDVGSEEHTSELQSLRHLVCRLLLEKKK